MKYELIVKEGIAKTSGKPYTMFLIKASTDNGQHTFQGMAKVDYNTKQAFDLMKEIEEK